MMNPLMLVKMLRSNPQDLMQSIMNNPQINNNPMVANAIEMLNKNDTDGLNKLAENLCKANGITMDEAKRRFGM